MQTFILRFKFKGDKLITLGVGLHSNEEDNFLNRIVKSELNKPLGGVKACSQRIETPSALASRSALCEYWSDNPSVAKKKGVNLFTSGYL